MIITPTTIDKEGSCNFCDKGELSIGGMSLIYPYKKVYSIYSGSGGGIKARVCESCAKQFIQFVTDKTNK